MAPMVASSRGLGPGICLEFKAGVLRLQNGWSIERAFTGQLADSTKKIRGNAMPSRRCSQLVTCTRPRVDTSNAIAAAIGDSHAREFPSGGRFIADRGEGGRDRRCQDEPLRMSGLSRWATAAPKNPANSIMSTSGRSMNPAAASTVRFAGVHVHGGAAKLTMIPFASTRTPSAMPACPPGDRARPAVSRQARLGRAARPSRPVKTAPCRCIANGLVTPPPMSIAKSPAQDPVTTVPIRNGVSRHRTGRARRRAVTVRLRRMSRRRRQPLPLIVPFSRSLGLPAQQYVRFHEADTVSTLVFAAGDRGA